jgi:Mlc titration factor MtfA (ptsG expression regulator)
MKQDLPLNIRKILNEKIYYYNLLNNQEKSRFEKMIQVFLAEIRITGIETDVDDECRVLTAASAVIPVFRIPEFEYDTLTEILIYPKSFNDNYEFDGPDTSILGMVQSGSVMILSKSDLYHGFVNYTDGRNVGIHEFAHKIDEGDGTIDGIPSLLMDKNLIVEWKQVVESESDKIRTQDSDINPYALTNPAEFFTVTSEYFFERPADMKRKHPKIYEILSKVYRQDTKSLFSGAIKDLFGLKSKKIGRNDPCPCGSGKKFKKCCLGK